MSEDQNFKNEAAAEPTTGSESTQQAPENAWDEVGKQFQALGESLAQAMRTAWENEETQRQVHQMRSGLESMVKDVEQAIQDSANSPQGQKIRQEAGRTAETLRTAGEQTVQEVRPQLIRALEQLNEELQKFISKVEKKDQA